MAKQPDHGHMKPPPGESSAAGAQATTLQERIRALAKTQPGTFDERLSVALVSSLWPLYRISDAQVLTRLDRFRRANTNRLHFVIVHHAEDPRVAPLLHQPELPLILDRLEADPTGLQDFWPTNVPRIWLKALAEAWGSPL
jgi:hypothetical protein